LHFLSFCAEKDKHRKKERKKYRKKERERERENKRQKERVLCVCLCERARARWCACFFFGNFGGDFRVRLLLLFVFAVVVARSSVFIVYHGLQILRLNRTKSATIQPDLHLGDKQKVPKFALVEGGRRKDRSFVYLFVCLLLWGIVLKGRVNGASPSSSLSLALLLLLLDFYFFARWIFVCVISGLGSALRRE
jgi:hypothetical protein